MLSEGASTYILQRPAPISLPGTKNSPSSVVRVVAFCWFSCEPSRSERVGGLGVRFPVFIREWRLVAVLRSRYEALKRLFSARSAEVDACGL